MSYIIAFVKFTDSEEKYPVGCFRTDLKIGDSVVVRLADRRLRPAVVEKLQYLNWTSTAYIECTISEASQESDGTLNLPTGSPLHFGLATHQALARSLKGSGWIPLKHYLRTYMIIFSLSNETQTANILLRKNGVDLQILADRHELKPAPMSVYEIPLTQGQVVRHYLAHTTFNLFEGIHRFATAFASNDGNYDRFLTSVGSKDKRTPEQKAKSRLKRNEMQDIYGAVSDGSGGPAYLGDGVWMTSGGGMHDWGR